MSSDEDDERVKLYNPLERNRKRQHFVSFSSSESDDDDDEASFYEESPLVRNQCHRSLRHSTSSRSAAQRAVMSLEDDDDDGNVEALMTEQEREALRQSELQIELEIAQRIAQDSVLNQTRAIMSKISSTQRQISDATAREIISLDSDDEDSVATTSSTSKSNLFSHFSTDDEDFQVLSSSYSSSSVHTNGSASQSSTTHYDKGERIMLKIRSNGERTDDVPIHTKEPFDMLYKNFCDLLGLPRSAVHMSLDGDPLSLTDTPFGNDLEAGDLIDAKVDFSKQSTANMKTFVRLRLIVEGKRPEIFKIDASSTIEKLHASFCKKHSIEFAEDVVLSALGVKLRQSETIESYGLRDDDEIAVEIENFVDPSAISVQLRFSDGTTESHHIVPSAKVETLHTSIAQLRNTSAQKVSLRLDGEAMAPSRSFQYYNLEGGELIEVKLAS